MFGLPVTGVLAVALLMLGVLPPGNLIIEVRQFPHIWSAAVPDWTYTVTVYVFVVPSARVTV